VYLSSATSAALGPCSIHGGGGAGMVCLGVGRGCCLVPRATSGEEDGDVPSQEGGVFAEASGMVQSLAHVATEGTAYVGRTVDRDIALHMYGVEPVSVEGVLICRGMYVNLEGQEVFVAFNYSYSRDPDRGKNIFKGSMVSVWVIGWEGGKVVVVSQYKIHSH